MGSGVVPQEIFFGPYIRLGRPTYGFRSMVLDASACINMYCNIERNIMKNQAGSPGFGIQGKISVYMCLCVMLSHCLFSMF